MEYRDLCERNHILFSVPKTEQMVGNSQTACDRMLSLFTPTNILVTILTTDRTGRSTQRLCEGPGCTESICRQCFNVTSKVL